MARGDTYTREELMNLTGVQSTSQIGANIMPNTPLRQPSKTDIFTNPEKDKSFIEKARDFSESIVGGGRVAEGLGKSLADTGISTPFGSFGGSNITENMSKAERQAQDIDVQLIKAIGEAQQAGNQSEINRLSRVRQQHLEQMKETGSVREDFINSLPSNREVFGSAVRLASTLVAPTIAGKATAGFKATQPLGIVQGAVQGAKFGAVGGAIEGAGQGLGTGIEQEKDAIGVAKSTLGGGLVGGILGGIFGSVLGGYKGKKALEMTDDGILQAVTPDGKEISPKQYEELVKRGRVTPRTATEAPKYVMTEGEKEVALKYKEIIDQDPVKSAQNISDTLGQLDKKVGSFLKKNNGIYSDGELRNALYQALADVDDITVDPQRITNKKSQMIENFIDSLDKNDMETLWTARKDFDISQSVDKAFQGSPTLSKEMKIAFRNGLQNFIADRTEEGVYKGLMYDMSNLYNLQDTVAVKATRARGLSALQAWAKANPIKAQALGYGTLGWLANEQLGGS